MHGAKHKESGNMEIRIVEETEMKKEAPVKKKFEIKEGQGEKCNIKTMPPKQVPEDMMLCEEVFCERTGKGMLSNCTICQALNNDIFVRCKTKYK